MSKIEIEIVDDNSFNKGWLMYLLGMDRPAESEPDADGMVYDHSVNGWEMGKEMRSIDPIRHVFTRQNDIDKPQYVVREVLPDKPMTNASKFPKITDPALRREAEASVALDHDPKVGTQS